MSKDYQHHPDNVPDDYYPTARWTYAPDDPDQRYVYDHDGAGHVVCAMIDGNDNDARLIAAAPDLLDAARTLMQYAEHFISTKDEKDSIDLALEQMEDAIRRATES